MERLPLLALVWGLFACAAPTEASNVRWSIGLNFGGPPVYHRPHYHYHYPLYRYHYVRPVYVEPAPVIVRPAPIVYEPAPVVVPAPVVTTPPPPRATIPVSGVTPVIAESSPSSIDALVNLLRNPDEKVRADAVLELGRSRSERVVDSLAATLAGDRSATVRDAAARALALLGSPRGLAALTHAAAADPDRDVRRSAQFAVEVIQNQRRD
jgi:hypothetical protein